MQWVSEKSDPNYVPPPDVAIDLTDNTFDDAVNNEELSLVMFFAPWFVSQHIHNFTKNN